MRLRAEVMRWLRLRTAGMRRLMLLSAVAWFVGIQAYFYVDLLTERSDVIGDAVTRVADVFR